MITFHKPEWIDVPGDVRLHAEVLLDAANPQHGVKPCPFCGSPHLSITNSHTPCFKVICDTCECEVSGRAVYPRSDHYTDKESALRGYRRAFKFALLAWNKRVTNEAAQAAETDWKKIAYALAGKVNFAIQYLAMRGGGSGNLYDSKTGKVTHWKDDLADTLEMLPGLTVDREMMHLCGLPRSQREKAIKALKAKRAAETKTEEAPAKKAKKAA